MPSCCGLTVTLRSQMEVVTHDVDNQLSQMTWSCAPAGACVHTRHQQLKERPVLVTVTRALLLCTHRRAVPHMLHQQLRGMPLLVGTACR